jgi:excisionase family DNA binding protein
MLRPSPAIERWVSVEEVAAHVGVRKDSIYRWIEKRGLPAQKIGKLWKLKLSNVDAWIKASGAKTDSAGSPPPSGNAVAADGPDQKARTDHILIVDDDESLRDTLSDIVSDQGYAALSAADGREALRLLRSADQPKPSLILLDLGLPNMDGLEFLNEQQRDLALAGIPVIVITAERRSEISGVPTLRKPLDIARLVDAIRGEIG